MNFFSKRGDCGYTLIEGIVAILILTLGILPSLSIVILASNFSVLIKNNLIAVNLAQEGIEVVRAIRDSNWFLNQPFISGLADGVYRVEWNSTSLMPLAGNPPISFNPNTGIYSYSAGAQTKFHRTITITNLHPAICDCELLVLSQINWQERGGQTKSVIVESHLFNWR